MLQQVREANEQAWSDMQSATQKAFAELQKGWGEAINRFMWCQSARLDFRPVRARKNLSYRKQMDDQADAQRARSGGLQRLR